MGIRLSIIAVVGLTMIVVAGTALGGGSGSTMAHAEANGWDCAPRTPILGYFHCAPPGKPSVQEMIDGDTSAASIVLRVFDPDDGSFVGIERLLRADIYGGQPCAQNGSEAWGELPFGYFACHNFDTGLGF
jgi:hypothetical protein